MAKLNEMIALAEVMALKKMQAQSRMAQVAAEEAQLRAQLAELQRPPTAQQDGISAALDPIRRAEAEMRWQRWADARRQTINTALARVLARKAEARSVLRRATGKDAALETLVEDARMRARVNRKAAETMYPDARYRSPGRR